MFKIFKSADEAHPTQSYRREVNLIFIFIFIFIFILIGNIHAQRVELDQLKSYADTTEALRTKNILPIDVANYIEVGGTFHGLISNVGTDKVTLTISDAVTVTSATIPANVVLDFTSNGSIIKASGTMTILGDIVAPKKKIFLSTVDLGSAKVSEVYPEWWGANDGVTNNATAISNAFNSKAHSVSFTNSIAITSKINIDFNDRPIKIFYTPGAQITTEDTASTGNIYHPDGVLTFTNSNDVTIENLYLDANNTGKLPGLTYNEPSDNYNDDDDNFLCALKISDCVSVTLRNVTATDAIYSGMFITDCLNVYLENCYANYNIYAGVFIQRTFHATVIGGEYSYNGLSTATGYLGGPYNFGYGLEFGNAFNLATGKNNDVTVTGVKAFYNCRYGIGGHQTLNAKITDNHIFGYGIIGIAFANQGFELFISNMVIKGNTIEQDDAWFASNNLGSTYTIAIQSGTYGTSNDVSGYNFSSLLIESNIITNSTSTKSGSVITDNLIHVWGSYTYSVQVKNNSMVNGTTEHGIYVGSGNYKGGQPTAADISENHFINITASEALDDNNALMLITAGQNLKLERNEFINCQASDTGNACIKIFNFDDTTGVFSNIVNANISYNSIQGTFYYGVFTGSDDAGDAINSQYNISHNYFRGTFTRWIITDPTTEQTQFFNEVSSLFSISGSATQSTMLPNVLSKGAGNAVYTIETAGV